MSATSATGGATLRRSSEEALSWIGSLFTFKREQISASKSIWGWRSPSERTSLRPCSRRERSGALTSGSVSRLASSTQRSAISWSQVSARPALAGQSS